MVRNDKFGLLEGGKAKTGGNNVTTPKLRPYQEQFVSQMRKSFSKHKHVLGTAAQGSGKTFCFSHMAKSSVDRGYKVLILSNRAKLLRQAGGSLSLFGIQAGFISAQHRIIPEERCVVAMAQTLQRRYMLPEYRKYLESIDLLIIDEIHQQDFNFLLESGIFKNKWVLGVTATAKRTGKQRQLGLDFDVLVEGLSVQHGIDLGFLVPAKHYTLDAPDLSDVGTDPISGDFKSKELFNIFDKPKLYGGVVSEFKRLCGQEKSICFCVNQIHAIKTCLEFNAAGIKSKFVVSGLKNDHEDYHLYESNKHLTGTKEQMEEEFENGDVVVLCNVGVYTTGADFPCIRNVIMNRATLSESLWDQMAGRGSRLFTDKPFFRILDFGGNILRHGLFERKKDGSLWHDYKEGGGVALTKECPELKPDREKRLGCGRLIHISYPTCPFCGYIFKTPEEIKEIELQEIIGGTFKFLDMTAVQLKAYAQLHGYKMQWVFNLLWAGNDEKGFRKGMRDLGYENKFIYREIIRLSSRKSK